MSKKYNENCILEHVAYMQKSWKMLSKIRSGEKIIESRWYKTKRTPYDEIHIGDKIFFKEGSDAISISAMVIKVIQFDNLNEMLIKDILTQYGKAIGISLSEMEKFKIAFTDKKYCILIFLGKIEEVQPFQVSKKGYGNMASWITVESVQSILA